MSSEEFVKRTREFAFNCVKLSEELPESKIGNHIRGQLVRCATSVASNYRAARLAQSKAAFVAKLSIVIEEADETEFWIDFALELSLLPKNNAKPLIKEAHELASMFIAARKTIQKAKS